MENRYDVEARMVTEAVAKFPETFGLRAYPGETFAVSKAASFVSEGVVYVYTVILKDGKWLSFAKGTPNELAREVVKL